MNQQLRLVYISPRTWEMTDLDRKRGRRGIAAARKALNESQPFYWDNNNAA